MKPFPRSCFSVLLFGLLVLAGCDTAVITNGNILGVQSGQFLYESGYLQSTYSYPVDQVWQACEQALKELKATSIDAQPKIGSGKLTANLHEDKIVIKVEYAGRDKTAVSVLAGIGGNQLASRLIHERIGKILSEGRAYKAAENPGSQLENPSREREALPSAEAEEPPIQPILSPAADQR